MADDEEQPAPLAVNSRVRDRLKAAATALQIEDPAVLAQLLAPDIPEVLEVLVQMATGTYETVRRYRTGGRVREVATRQPPNMLAIRTVLEHVYGPPPKEIRITDGRSPGQRYLESILEERIEDVEFERDGAGGGPAADGVSVQGVQPEGEAEGGG